jgi:hypothetical protein
MLMHSLRNWHAPARIKSSPLLGTSTRICDDDRRALVSPVITDRLRQSRLLHLPFHTGNDLFFNLYPIFLLHHHKNIPTARAQNLFSMAHNAVSTEDEYIRHLADQFGPVPFLLGRAPPATWRVTNISQDGDERFETRGCWSASVSRRSLPHCRFAELRAGSHSEASDTRLSSGSKKRKL